MTKNLTTIKIGKDLHKRLQILKIERECKTLSETINLFLPKYEGSLYPKETVKIKEAYYNMLDRCYNPKSTGYPSYGAKGVTVCDEWLDNRDLFIEWARDNGHSMALELDKDIKSHKLGINPHIYSPITCTWVTRAVNQRQKLIEQTGVTTLDNGIYEVTYLTDTNELVTLNKKFTDLATATLAFNRFTEAYREELQPCKK